jgi:hypothetical protein
MRSAAALVLGIVLAAAPSPAAAEEPAPPAPAPPAPAEPTIETLHGLPVHLLVPKPKPEEGYSLLVYFHGAVGSGKDAVTLLAPFAGRGFILAGPTSKQGEWTVPEMESVRAVARTLAERFQVPRERRHVAGFWSGAAGVPTVAFDEALGCRTATWIDGGWGGGSVAKWAKEELNGLFLTGAREGPSRVEAHRKAASLLGDRVLRSLAHEAPQEPGLGRSRKEDPEFPVSLVPFWGYFMECMEGRFTPGRDLSFEWGEDLEQARAAMAERKTGGLVYVYAEKPDGPESERTRTLQNEVLFDRVVRHFAGQLVPVKLEKSKAKDLLESAKVAETPALIVFKRGGKEILRACAGEIAPKALIPVLRAAAPDAEMPR